MAKGYGWFTPFRHSLRGITLVETILCLISGIALILLGMSGNKFHVRFMRLNAPVPTQYWRIWLLILGGMLLTSTLPGAPPPGAHHFFATVILILAAVALPAGILAVLVGWGLCWGKEKADQRATLCGAFVMLWGVSLIWYALAIWAARR